MAKEKPSREEQEKEETAGPARSGDGELSETERQGLEEYLRGKQAAVLAVLFSDIEGYTTMTERLGDLQMPKIREYFSKQTFEITRRDGAGWVVKNIGDSYLSVFAEPSTSVLRALEMQEAFRRFRFEGVEGLTGGEEGLSVRIGIHLGQVSIEKSIQMDVFGRHVNMASRVMSLAAGGQVYVSRSVYDAARGWMQEPGRESLKWENHGSYRLKGFDEAVEIWEVVDPSVASPRSPLGAERARAFTALSTRTSSRASAGPISCSSCAKEFASRLSVAAKCLECGAPICHVCAALSHAKYCAQHRKS